MWVLRGGEMTILTKEEIEELRLMLEWWKKQTGYVSKSKQDKQKSKLKEIEKLQYELEEMENDSNKA